MPTAAATLAFQTNPVMAVSPVVFQVPGRRVDLQVKVTAPLAGNDLPILILSHGHGRSNFLSSMRGYAPLVDYYAAKGFVVIQPTHQNSKALAVQVTGSERELFWRSRAADVKFIVDHLDAILSAVPGLSGRADKHQLALLGHSLGGHDCHARGHERQGRGRHGGPGRGTEDSRLRHPGRSRPGRPVGVCSGALSHAQGHRFFDHDARCAVFYAAAAITKA